MLGWILLHKPVGISSFQALTPIKQLLRKRYGSDKNTKMPKVGHAGTLDPFAEGLLVVAIGQATRLINYAMNGVKEYICTIQWGEERDAGDITGKVTNQSSVIPTADEIQRVLPDFLGTIQQRPHIYSAIKIGGERSYNIAREGRNIELAARPVEVCELELLHHDATSKTSEVRILCGKGFYVRSFVVDLAGILGTYAYAAKLCRTKVGKFLLDNALKMTYICDQVRDVKGDSQMFFDNKNIVLPVIEVFNKSEMLQVGYSDAEKLLHGQKIEISNRSLTGEIAIISDCKLIAIVVVKDAICTPRVVFNN